MPEQALYLDPLPDPLIALPDNFRSRFWQKDPSLWPAGAAADVAGMLGWVDVLGKVGAHFDEIDAFVESVIADGFTKVVLCGMGGSSLAPYVLREVFGELPGGLPLTVLDSTHPGSIQAILDSGIENTLFIVASKSGSTAEPTTFDKFFFDRVGNPNAFVAITDPGSPFHRDAEARNFRKIFLNYADIGGRFSALSLFGLVPAALLGVDIRKFLQAALDYAAALQIDESDAFDLGQALGSYAKTGRNKLTILTDDRLSSFGLWLEQLVAESTGKFGTGILPIAGETVGAPEVYGDDRFFAAYNVLPVANPSFHVHFEDPYQLAVEFLRWEVATAAAGAILEINPFDQPNVQESKDVTKRILAAVEAEGELPETDKIYAASNEKLSEFLGDVAPGDYICIQAYLHETPELDVQLKTLQSNLRDTYKVPVTMGYGPRFLHSTGQFHKGGPNVGHFVQLLDQPQDTISIPGQRADWTRFVLAQARGDYEALAEKGRRIVALNLGSEPAQTLQTLIS
ncbi:bifunctional transaldolase/phosoglucose isomerase [Fimbriimonadaceae bacterium]